MSDEILDNPVHASLFGAHSHFALSSGRVARYPADISPFMAVPDDVTPDEWRALAQLAAGAPVTLVNPPTSVPVEWDVVRELDGLQMIGGGQPGAQASTTVQPTLPSGWTMAQLGPADAADMLELATATAPGPFANRTGELGFYVGVRDRGRLVAMAGERMRPAGWTEVSAVCTDPQYRGRGLARMLMEHVAAQIRARGDRPFLHVVAANAGAIHLYESMGYRIRRTVTIRGYQAA